MVPVDDELIRAAIDQADRRRPDRDCVAAAVRIGDGGVLTGVSLANYNAAMTLCAETGPICTAYSSGQQVVASVCITIDRPAGTVTVLAPCGACQERLALWGPDVQVGVADDGRAGGWSSRRLLELNPCYRAADAGAWPVAADHEW